MLEITNYRDGAVLDHNHGIETDEYLEIIVEGLAAPQADVRGNGTPARRHDRNFSCPVRLTGKVNTITVESSDYFGVKTQTITVLWDKKSFKRYNFFIDDCSFFLRSIALSKPASIFEEMFWGRLKKIHDKFGTKFTLNLFFHDDHHDFSISDFPADYKQEFQTYKIWKKRDKNIPEHTRGKAQRFLKTDTSDVTESQVAQRLGLNIPSDISAEELRAFRDKMNMTQAKMAERFGVSKSAYQKCEQGASTMPEHHTANYKQLLANLSADVEIADIGPSPRAKTADAGQGKRPH